MRKFLITEEDRKHILGLYGLLKEDIDPNSGGTITIKNYYPAGYYTLENVDTKSKKKIQDQIYSGLTQVTDFVKKHPDSIVSVKFISQESAIPNKDNEGKHGGSYLEVGGLSDLRKQYLEPYIKTYFDNLKAQGVIGKTVEVPPLVYDKQGFVTPWVGTPFCPANSTLEQQRSDCYNKYKAGKTTTYKEYFDKYQTEQRSELEITVRIKQPTTPVTTTTTTVTTPGDYSKCAAGLTIRVWVKTHQCQNAEFFIFANDLLLYNSQGGMTANLNNAENARGIPRVDSEPIFQPEYLNPGFGYLKNGDGTFGSYSYGKINESGDLKGSRSDTFKLTKEQSLKLLNAAKGKISLWMIATTTSAHKDIPQVTITKEDGTVIYDKAPKIVQGKLLTLDGCTLKVVEGTDETVPDVTGYVNLIRQERMSLQSQAGIDDAAKSGTKKQQKKKQATLDSKGKILERASDLVNQMTTFLNYLKPALIKTTPPAGSASMANPGSPEIQAEIDKYYKIFYSGVTYAGTPESPEPQLAQDPDGDYINNTVGKDELYGDIRLYMDQFYEGFNAVYRDDEGVISPTGIRTINSKGVDKGLRGSKILSNLKKLKQYTL
jgi:hypothetical protein